MLHSMHIIMFLSYYSTPIKTTAALTIPLTIALHYINRIVTTLKHNTNIFIDNSSNTSTVTATKTDKVLHALALSDISLLISLMAIILIIIATGVAEKW